MKRSRLLALGLSTGIALSQISIARAQPGGSEEEALTHFIAGRKLLEADDASGALQELEIAAKLSPSPNTALVMGHALRRLNRRVEALSRYESAGERASERVRGGEERYRATADEANRWIVTLKAELGELAVSLRRPPEAASAALDGVALTLRAEGDRTRTTTFAEPGEHKLTVRASNGKTLERVVSLVRGARTLVELDLEPPAAPPPAVTVTPIAPPLAPRSGPPPAALVAAGVGVAGLAVFAIFEGMAASSANKLSTCSPNCPESLRPDADAGRRDEAIAWVGLGVGAASLATGAVLWIAARRTNAASGAASPNAALVGFPGGAAVRGSF